MMSGGPPAGKDSHRRDEGHTGQADQSINQVYFSLSHVHPIEREL